MLLSLHHKFWCQYPTILHRFNTNFIQVSSFYLLLHSSSVSTFNTPVSLFQSNFFFLFFSPISYSPKPYPSSPWLALGLLCPSSTFELPTPSRHNPFVLSTFLHPVSSLTSFRFAGGRYCLGASAIVSFSPHPHPSCFVPHDAALSLLRDRSLSATPSPCLRQFVLVPRVI